MKQSKARSILNTLHFDIADIIEAHIALISETKKELRKLPDGRLDYRNGKNGRIFYRQTIQRNGKTKSKGITRNKDAVSKLARKRFLKKQLKILNNNLDFLTKKGASFVTPTAGNILSLIGSDRFGLDRSLFTGRGHALSEWSKNYERDMTHSEHNVIPTSLGIRVKSKIEKDILENLLDYDIEFRYEMIHYFGRDIIAPDFTIRVGDELVIWEHFGRMDDQGYVKVFLYKLDIYIKNGFIPGKNLILTFEGGGQYLSSNEIRAIIESKLL